VICWSCERAAGDGALCAFCGAIQPADAAADHFAVLGVPARFALDLGAGEARFRELSRALHPDRFAQADPRARRLSLQRTVQLNEAWRTLKDPVRRAEYLLGRAGYQVGAETGASRPGRAAGEREKIPVSPALLGEILELREELSEARAAGDHARVRDMAIAVRAQTDAALGRVAAGFERARATDAAAPDPALDAVAEELIAVRYFRRFLEEVAVHDEAVAAEAEGARPRHA
jgi:molecular chaperone HscB